MSCKFYYNPSVQSGSCPHLSYNTGKIVMQTMTPNEYQILAKRTECDQRKSVARVAPQVDIDAIKTEAELVQIRLFHSTIGVGGEVGELRENIDGTWVGNMRDINLAEELGDITWYLAQSCNALQIDMKGIFDKSNDIPIQILNARSESKLMLLVYGQSQLSLQAGKMCYVMQRWVFYGKPFDADIYITTMANIIRIIRDLCSIFSLNIGQVFIANIAKLKKRYADKYTDFESAEENRDRTAEAATIGKIVYGDNKGQTYLDPRSEAELDRHGNPIANSAVEPIIVGEKWHEITASLGKTQPIDVKVDQVGNQTGQGWAEFKESEESTRDIRRKQVAEKVIRPTIDKLIADGVLPQADYQISWVDRIALHISTELEEGFSEIANGPVGEVVSASNNTCQHCQFYKSKGTQYCATCGRKLP